jgi:hypothetical protein
MKILQILVFLLCVNACSFSQNIAHNELLGVWQCESKEIASAWLDTYQFYADGHFVFNLNQYDEARRVLAIKGHYRIVKDTLFFKVEATIELIGGYFERNTLTTTHGSWSLVGDLVKKEIKQPEKEEQTAMIKQYCEKQQSKCIFIDGSVYYKISSNPDDFN